jgi:hypothetical protein
MKIYIIEKEEIMKFQPTKNKEQKLFKLENFHKNNMINKLILNILI